MNKSAQLSECGRYRYNLTRSWRHNRNSQWVLFIMLNPSTADDSEDDPTVRRCIGFAEEWGYDGLAVVNLYSYRATDPLELWNPHIRANGRHSDEFIKAMISVCSGVVCAWGKPGPDPTRPVEVYNLIRAHHRDPMALRINKDGSPGHPLYIPKASRLIRYEMR